MTVGIKFILFVSKFLYTQYSKTEGIANELTFKKIVVISLTDMRSILLLFVVLVIAAIVVALPITVVYLAWKFFSPESFWQRIFLSIPVVLVWFILQAICAAFGGGMMKELIKRHKGTRAQETVPNVEPRRFEPPEKNKGFVDI